MTYSIRMEAGDGGPVIVVSGEADSTASPLLDEKLGAACNAAPAGVVVVDVSDAEFVDSRTMSVLVNWTERQRAGGGRLPIVCPNSNMLRVFRQIGLDQVLEIVSSRDDLG